MTIEPGQAVPDVQVWTMVDGAPTPGSSRELLSKGRVVLFGVPGAFSPGCSQQHLPGYAARADELSRKGVDRIACVAVNDVFVMDAWATSQGVGDSILMLADPEAAFATALGTRADVPGMGVRSTRFAAILDDGVLVDFLPEPDGFAILESSAECVLARL